MKDKINKEDDKKDKHKTIANFAIINKPATASTIWTIVNNTVHLFDPFFTTFHFFT